MLLRQAPLSCRPSWTRPASACSHAQLARPRRIHCNSAGQDASAEVYEGVYGPWRIEQADVLEVWGYRVGLSVAAAAFAAGSTAAFTGPESQIAAALNPLFLVGAAGLGVSLQLIHIYVTPLKRTIQVFWALGTAGGIYLMLSHPDAPMPLYVAQHSGGVWLVGPLAAAMTGVAFKEGLCYGKAEAAALFFALPLLMLTHLSGAAPVEVERTLLGLAVGLCAIFAARKYTQAVKDDIGDKSVFEFQKSSPEEQARLEQQRRQQQGQ